MRLPASLKHHKALIFNSHDYSYLIINNKNEIDRILVLTARRGETGLAGQTRETRETRKTEETGEIRETEL